MSIVEEEEYGTISWIEVGQDWEWYYFVPLLDRQEWDGIEYDSVQYGWDELDYRFGVEYSGPSVPEPSFTGLLMGLAILGFLVYKKIK
tara:strand:+ start:166 stop:429 length:264 start_codon:yes stop_codon:yes gene_type:complete